MADDEWRKDPPFPENDLGRSVNDISAAGDRWRRIPLDVLVGICGRSEVATDHPYIKAGAQAELARRSLDAQATLNTTLLDASAAAAEHSRKLEAASEASATQTNEVIKLTVQLKKLTVVITVLTVLATIFGAIQATAVLVHLYRWYRGWS